MTPIAVVRQDRAIRFSKNSDWLEEPPAEQRNDKSMPEGWDAGLLKSKSCKHVADHQLKEVRTCADAPFEYA